MASQNKIHFLRMKLECIIKMHDLVDAILEEFDQKGMTPKIDKINEFRKQEPTQANLNANLKLALDTIKKEISDLEDAGYEIYNIRKGKIRWKQGNEKCEWEYTSNEFKILETN